MSSRALLDRAPRTGLVSEPAVVSVTVEPVNDPPVASGVSVATSGVTPVAIVLSGSDVDGDPLTFSVVTEPSHGSLSGTGSNLIYLPVSGYVGADSFMFAANDGQVSSEPATVSIDVTTPPNRAPVGVADSFTTGAGVALTVGAPGVLSNDTDPDPGDTLTASLQAGPTNGTVELAGDGSFRYVPRAGFNGTDTFTYTAVDSSLARSGSTTVSVVVEPPTCSAIKTVSSVNGTVTFPDGGTLKVDLARRRLPFGLGDLWVGSIDYRDDANQTRVIAGVLSRNQIVRLVPGLCGGIQITVGAVMFTPWPRLTTLTLTINNKPDTTQHITLTYPGTTHTTNTPPTINTK